MQDEPKHTTDYDYNAFISYRHLDHDMAISKKLQELLESYRPPKGTVCKNSDRVERVFRDMSDMSATGNLTQTIREILEKSQFLIVLFSRETKDSTYCMEEIRYFKSINGGKNDRIITVLIDDTPKSELPEELATAEIEPYYNDISAATTSKSIKKLKSVFLRIVSQILGCSYDDLYRRHERRRRQRIITWAVSIITVLIFFLGVVGYFWFSSTKSENKARNSLAELYTRQAGIALGENNLNLAMTYFAGSLKLNPENKTLQTAGLGLLLQANAWPFVSHECEGVIVEGFIVMHEQDINENISKLKKLCVVDDYIDLSEILMVSNNGEHLLIRNKKGFYIITKTGAIVKELPKSFLSHTPLSDNKCEFFMSDDIETKRLIVDINTGELINIKITYEINPKCDGKNLASFPSMATYENGQKLLLANAGYLFFYELKGNEYVETLKIDLADGLMYENAEMYVPDVHQIWIDKNETVAAVSGQNNFCLVNLKTQKINSKIIRYDFEVKSIAISDDFSRIAVAYGNNAKNDKMYNIAGGYIAIYNSECTELFTTKDRYNEPFAKVEFNSDCSRLLAYGYDDRLHIFNLKELTGNEECIPVTAKGNIKEAVFANDFSICAVQSYGSNNLHFYNFLSPKDQDIIDFKNNYFPIMASLQINNNIAEMTGRTVTVIDEKSNEVINTVVAAYDLLFAAIIPIPDENKFISIQNNIYNRNNLHSVIMIHSENGEVLAEKEFNGVDIDVENISIADGVISIELETKNRLEFLILERPSISRYLILDMDLNILFENEIENGYKIMMLDSTKFLSFYENESFFELKDITNKGLSKIEFINSTGFVDAVLTKDKKNAVVATSTTMGNESYISLIDIGTELTRINEQQIEYYPKNLFIDPNHDKVALTTSVNKIITFDANDISRVNIINKRNNGQISDIVFDGSGQFLAFSSIDIIIGSNQMFYQIGALEVWDFKGNSIVTQYNDGQNYIMGLAFTKNNDLLYGVGSAVKRAKFLYTPPDETMIDMFLTLSNYKIDEASSIYKSVSKLSVKQPGDSESIWNNLFTVVDSCEESVEYVEFDLAHKVEEVMAMIGLNGFTEELLSTFSKTDELLRKSETEYEISDIGSFYNLYLVACAGLGKEDQLRHVIENWISVEENAYLGKKTDLLPFNQVSRLLSLPAEWAVCILPLTKTGDDLIVQAIDRLAVYLEENTKIGVYGSDYSAYSTEAQLYSLIIQNNRNKVMDIVTGKGWEVLANRNFSTILYIWDNDFKKASESFNEHVFLLRQYAESDIDFNARLRNVLSFVYSLSMREVISIEQLNEFIDMQTAFEGLLIIDAEDYAIDNGFKEGDIIVEADGMRIVSIDQFHSIFKNKKDSFIDVILIRGGKEIRISPAATGIPFKMYLEVSTIK